MSTKEASFPSPRGRLGGTKRGQRQSLGLGTRLQTTGNSSDPICQTAAEGTDPTSLTAGISQSNYRILSSWL